MNIGDEIISIGGNRAYITSLTIDGGCEAISCFGGGAIHIHKNWIGTRWILSGKTHEGLRKILEEICSTQNSR